MPDNGIVYHYCSLEAFKSIIENKCLWLCDVQKSNDSQECLLLPERIKKIAEESKFIEQFDSWKRDAVELIFKNLLSSDYHNPVHRTTYTCCFSNHGDQLSQWRGYTPDASGLCIGFRKKYFSELARPEWDFLSFGKVNYQDDELSANAEEELQNIYSSINELSDDLKLDDNDTQLRLIQIVLRIWTKAAQFKAFEFCDEDESRFTFSANTSMAQSYTGVTSVSIDTLAATVIREQDNFSLSNLKYRITNGHLQGYHELCFEHIKDKIISEIIIGPKCQVTEKDI